MSRGPVASISRVRALKSWLKPMAAGLILQRL
jgi:hypothetical protein